MDRVTTVELYAPTLKTKRRFEIGHATRILKVTRGGWELPENSKYELVNNELKLTADKRKTDKPSKSIDSPKSD